MFTSIIPMKGTAKRHMLFWRGGTFALLVLALLVSGFVGGGIEVAHASAQLLPQAISSQQADAAPALSSLNGTTAFISWTGVNTAHNLNLMSYDPTSGVFGPAQVLIETTPAGSGPSLTAWNTNLYMAWLGIDNRLNVGQYNPANPTHLANKVTLNERSTNAPTIFGWPGYLYLGWRGMDGHLNIVSSTDGSHFGAKITYSYVIRTSPALIASDNSLLVAWEDMSASSHIVFASSNNPSNPTNLTSVVTTTSTSLFPVGLEAEGVPAPFVRVAWRTSDAHIHIGTFGGAPVISNPIDTAQTTPYGPALFPASSLPLMSWTGTDATHHINVISLPY